MKMALESNLSSIMWVFVAFITLFMFFVSLKAQSYVMATDMITTSIQIEAVTSEAACNTVVGSTFKCTNFENRGDEVNFTLNYQFFKSEELKFLSISKTHLVLKRN